MSTITEQNEHGEDVQITTRPSGAVVRELLRPAPAPSLPRTLSVLAFRSRFSDGEKIAIYTAAETSAAIRVWLDDLAAAQNQTVDLDDPRIIGGVNAIEYGGMLAAGRAAEILA